MGITLTSKAINSTYDSLLKLSDNDQLTGAFKVITDGLGNDTGISINNTNQVNIAGQLVVNSSITANSFVRSGGLSSQFLKADGSVDSNTYQSVHQKGLANGYAPLDGGAKISEAYLPDSIVGQLEYQGTWNATTNTPTLPSASTVKGHYYVTSVAGTYQTIEYAVGDWVISNGTSWEKVDNTDAVTTVFGRIGAIIANSNDYSSFYHPLNGDLAANASTATTLQTARLINGTSFNGSANITTANWGTSRTITIGDTGKSLNGSTNVTWSRAELGITKVNIDALNIDADTLDNLNSTQFLRSDTSDTMSGTLNITGSLAIGKTTTPVTTLDINGGILASGNIATSSGQMSASGGNSTQWTNAYSYSQIGHLPLTGGTLTGGLNVANGILDIGQNRIDGSSDNLKISADNNNVSGSSTIEFLVDGSEKMRINNSGNVGIGTSSPANAAKLTIIGNQTFGLPGNGTNTSARFISIEGNADSSGEGSGRVFFTEHNSTTAAMDNYGMSLAYRGGSTSIVGASGNTWTGLTQIGNGEWGMFGHDNDATGVKIMQGSRSATYTAFYSSGSETMRLTGGNVGIGTTTPVGKLSVLLGETNLSTASAAATTGYPLSIRFTGTASDNNLIRHESSANPTGYYTLMGTRYDNNKSFVINNKGSEIITYSDITSNGLGLSGGAGNLIRFTTNSSERMRITSSGFVRIGTEDNIGIPSIYGLAAIEGTDAQLDLTSSSAGTWGSSLNFIEGNGTSNTNVWSIARTTSGGGNNLRFNFGVNNQHDNDTKVTFDSSGNVGIGTSSPSKKLSISGVKNTPIIHLGSTTNDASWAVGDKIGAIEFGSADSSGAGAGLKASISYEVEAGTTGSSNSMIFRSAGTAAGTNNAERMRIDSSGNIGIGRSSISQPSAGATTLAIQGTSTDKSGAIRLYSSNDSVQAYIYADVTSGLSINTSTSHPMVFRTAASERIRITSTGNVGIDTASPSHKFHAHSSTNNDYVARFEGSTNNSAGVWTGIGIGGEASNTKSAIIFEDIGESYSRGKLHLAVNNELNQNNATKTDAKLTISNNGNVGIGTTSPTSLLEISKQLSAASAIDYPYTISSRDDANSINQAGGEGVGIKFRIAGNAATTPGDSLVGASIAAIRESASDTDSSTGLGFFVTQNDETLDEAVRIDHDGNVGIGTTSPIGNFNINGGTGDSTSENAIQTLTRTSSTGNVLAAKLVLTAPTTYQQNLVFRIKTTASSAESDAFYTDAMTIASNGNVGIGTTTPSSSISSSSTVLQIEDSNVASLALNHSSIGKYEIAATGLGLDIRRNGSNYLTVNTSGNVGIGTTSPATNLEIGAGANIAPKLRLTLFDSGSSINDGQEYGGIQWSGNDGQGNGVRADIRVFGGGTSGESYMTFGTMPAGFSANTNAQERMRITSSGTVQTNVTKALGSATANLRIKTTFTGTNYSSGAYANIVFGDETITNSYLGDIQVVQGDPSVSTSTSMRFLTNTGGGNTATQERMRIASNGNVGIGTTNPKSKLHVAKAGNTNGGSLLIGEGGSGSSKWSFLAGAHYNQDTGSGNGAGAAGVALIGSYNTITENRVYIGGNPYELNAATSISFNTHTSSTSTQGGTERMRIDSAGNVGIGTTAPSAKLEISSSATIPALILTSDGGNEQFKIRRHSNNNEQLIIGFHSSDYAQIQAVEQNVGYRPLSLNPNGGNVGIGTTAPVLKLHLIGTNSLPATSGTTQNGGIRIENGVNNGVLDIGASNATGAPGWIQSTDKSDLSQTYNLLLNPNGGNVGIGTTTPAGKLQIYGSQPYIYITNTAENGAGIVFNDAQAATGQAASIQFNSGNETLGFFVNDASTERVRIQTNGDTHFSGDVVAYSTSISDERLKDNIETIPNALDKVNLLRGVSYVWNKGSRKGQKDLGLIAQEVEKVLPEIVREKEMSLIDDSGIAYKTIDYEKMVGVLIEAIKEQQQQIDELKKRLDGVTN
jgi:hypothetical protein